MEANYLSPDQLRNLSLLYGKPIHQRKSERIFGFDAELENLPAGCELFVTNLPKHVYEDMLLPLFYCAGEVVQLRLLMEDSDHSRGSCYVTYNNPEIAARAVYALHGFNFGNSILQCQLSLDNCRLFINNIPQTMDQETVVDVIKKYIDGVREVHVSVPEDEAKNPGFIFIEFMTHMKAAFARKRIYETGFFIGGNAVNAEWARPWRYKTKRNQSSILIENIPPRTTKEELLDFIMDVISKDKCVVVINETEEEPCAIVEFSTWKHAQNAWKIINGITYKGYELVATKIEKSIETYDSSDEKYSDSSSEGLVNNHFNTTDIWDFFTSQGLLNSHFNTTEVCGSTTEIYDSTTDYSNGINFKGYDFVTKEIDGLNPIEKSSDYSSVENETDIFNTIDIWDSPIDYYNGTISKGDDLNVTDKSSETDDSSVKHNTGNYSKILPNNNVDISTDYSTSINNKWYESIGKEDSSDENYSGVFSTRLLKNNFNTTDAATEISSKANYSIGYNIKGCRAILNEIAGLNLTSKSSNYSSVEHKTSSFNKVLPYDNYNIADYTDDINILSSFGIPDELCHFITKKLYALKILSRNEFGTNWIYGSKLLPIINKINASGIEIANEGSTNLSPPTTIAYSTGNFDGTSIDNSNFVATELDATNTYASKLSSINYEINASGTEITNERTNLFSRNITGNSTGKFYNNFDGTSNNHNFCATELGTSSVYLSNSKITNDESTDLFPPITNTFGSIADWTVAAEISNNFTENASLYFYEHNFI